VTPLPRSPLRDIALLFLKLGTTAFGGPAAHLGLMEAEVVRRRKWLTHAEFLDLVGAANLIPGPNSTELAIHIGYRRGGWPGLLLAGICFIVPAMLIVLGLSWVYVQYGTVPQLLGVLRCVKPVVIAVIVQALWRLGCSAIKSRTLATAGVAVGVLNVLGVNELLVLFGAGVLLAVLQARRGRGPQAPSAAAALAVPLLPFAVGAPVVGAAASASVGLVPLFLFFAKVGAVLYGSGYVLIAFLRADLVHRWQWLTESQLLDAVAIGQVTPGPLFTTATFIGYVLAGVPGAALATAGIFLPAFVFVALSAPLIPRLRASPIAGAFLDGVNVASLALMAVVTGYLLPAVFVDVTSAVLAVAGAVALLRFKVNSSWLVLAAAVLGLCLS
jgi:chromate transporter